MKKITTLLTILCLGLGIAMQTAAAQNNSPAAIEKMLQDVRFQFQPDKLQGPESNTAFLQGLYEKTPEFPLWLMMEMGGALIVDRDKFTVAEVKKDEDGVWLLDMSCIDTENGYFRLLFGVDAASGDAVLKVADAEEDLALYQGKILPYEGVRADIRSGRRAQQAQETERELDRIIPALDFTVRLNAEIYGRSSVTVTPDKVVTTAPMTFESEDYRVICCEKQGDMWFVRFELTPAEEDEEAWVLDLAINALTAETSYRMNFTDNLPASWRNIIDGRVELPKK